MTKNPVFNLATFWAILVNIGQLLIPSSGHTVDNNLFVFVVLSTHNSSSSSNVFHIFWLSTSKVKVMFYLANNHFIRVEWRGMQIEIAPPVMIRSLWKFIRWTLYVIKNEMLIFNCATFPANVTRFDYLLDLWQLLKAFGNK